MSIYTPEGFTYVPCPDDRHVEFIMAGGYIVTVDFVGRCFRFGSTTIGPSRTAPMMRGRGWRERLIDAATQQLKDYVK